MRLPPAILANHLLQALLDIAYVVDTEGILIRYSETRWNDFASSNETPELMDPESILGKSLYCFIADEETRNTYRNFSHQIMSGRRDSIQVYFECDSPDVARRIRLSISPIKIKGAPVGLLYQNTVMEQHTRPPVTLLQRSRLAAKGAPLLGICSYCKKVRIPPDCKDGEWVTTEIYYQRGGTDDVQLSHGICPSCYQDLINTIRNGTPD